MEPFKVKREFFKSSTCWWRIDWFAEVKSNQPSTNIINDFFFSIIHFHFCGIHIGFIDTQSVSLTYTRYTLIQKTRRIFTRIPLVFCDSTAWRNRVSSTIFFRCVIYIVSGYQIKKNYIITFLMEAKKNWSPNSSKRLFISLHFCHVNATCSGIWPHM